MHAFRLLMPGEARVGRVPGSRVFPAAFPARRWEAELDLPRLSAYGIGEGDLARIVAASRGGSMKTNPIVLSDTELTDLLAARL